MCANTDSSYSKENGQAIIIRDQNESHALSQVTKQASHHKEYLNNYSQCKYQFPTSNAVLALLLNVMFHITWFNCGKNLFLREVFPKQKTFKYMSLSLHDLEILC